MNFRGDDLLSFKLSLNNPSKIAELQEIEHWKQKFDIAGSATEGYFSRRWVAENIFGMNPPVNIWPDPSVRFRDDQFWQWIDTSKYLLLPPSTGFFILAIGVLLLMALAKFGS